MRNCPIDAGIDAGLAQPLPKQILIAAMVGDVGVAHGLQLLHGSFQAAATAAVQVQGRFFIRAGSSYTRTDLLHGNIDGALQMT